MWRFLKFVVFSIIIVTLSFGIYKLSNRYDLNLIYKNVDWSINTKGLEGAVSFDFDKENNLYIAFKNTIKMINKDNKEEILLYDKCLNIYDIACYNDDWVREAISLKDYTFSTTNGKTAKLTNTNKNLGTNYCIAGKTGYTTKAGRCLVAIYEKDGHKLVGVILGGDYTGIFDDMNKLMDYSFNIQKKTIVSKEEEISKIKVKFKPLKYFGKAREYEIPVFTKEDITDYDNDFNEKYRTTNINKTSFNSWDLNNSTVVGKVQVKEKNSVKSYDLYTNVTTDNLIKYSKSFYVDICINFIITIIVIIFILFTIRYINLKTRRKLRYKHKKKIQRH